jgi:nucleolar pre-ribosomal-associated protein 2
VESITKIKILVRRCIAPYIGPTVVQISVDARSCKYWLSMHRMVARLQICNDIGELIQLSQSILRLGMKSFKTCLSITLRMLDLSARQTQDLIGVVKDAFASFDTPAMLEQLPLLLPQQEEKSDAGCLRLLDVLIPTLESKSLCVLLQLRLTMILASDSADVKRQLLAVLGNLSAHLATSEDLACYNALLDCIDTILRSKVRCHPSPNT